MAATDWKRHSYPVNTLDVSLSNGSPVSPSGTIQEDARQTLPRNVRAVKDPEDYRHKGRNLIICLDGTGDKFDADNSNIVHIVGCLKKDDPSQVTYYQSGIGTYDGGGLSNGLNAAADMAVGSGLGVHIQDAYHFLMQTYREGDNVILFGFSRGAYTARCLAGMIHKVLAPNVIDGCTVANFAARSGYFPHITLHKCLSHTSSTRTTRIQAGR